MKERSWALPGIVVALAAACMPAAFAQTHTLKEGFDAAWARQPESRSAALRRDAAQAAIAAAQRWTPEAAALEIAARTDRYHGNEGAREYDAAIAVPLWLPGERSGAQASAAALAQAEDARLAAAQWRVAAQVREAWWNWQRASMEEGLAQARHANARQLADDVARRIRAGDLARADGHQAEGAAAAAKSAWAEAGVARARAAQAWRVLTGRAQTPAEFGRAAVESLPSSTELDGAHPAVRELAGKAQVAQRQQALAAIQVRSNPELTLGTTRERGAEGERWGQTLAIGIRIPLGKSSAGAARLLGASADQLEAQTQLSLETERLSAELDMAKTTLASLQQAQSADEQRLQLARESRGFFEKAFRLGESDLPTRLRVELEAFEAERQAVRSRLEVAAAISQLRQALGLLPE